MTIYEFSIFNFQLLFVHLQHLINNRPIVLQSRDFVLTADATLAAEPVFKEVFAGEGDFGRGEGEILVTLGVVIGIEAAKLKVESAGEGGEVVGLDVKLDEPLMTAALVGLHIDRGGGVVADVGAGGVAGGADGA